MNIFKKVILTVVACVIPLAANAVPFDAVEFAHKAWAIWNYEVFYSALAEQYPQIQLPGEADGIPDDPMQDAFEKRVMILYYELSGQILEEPNFEALVVYAPLDQAKAIIRLIAEHLDKSIGFDAGVYEINEELVDAFKALVEDEGHLEEVARALAWGR